MLTGSGPLVSQPLDFSEHREPPKDLGRGLHSSTFRVNLSAFCGIGGALRGCLGGVRGLPGAIKGVFCV